jgi:hypothetical protein
MFTGKLPDPSRSFVTYESVFDLQNLDFYEKIKPIIDQACASIEVFETVESLAYGQTRPLKMPRGQVKSLQVTELSGMRILVKVSGENVKHGTIEHIETMAWMCYQCQAIWWKSPRHPKSQCAVYDTEQVMES